MITWIRGRLFAMFMTAGGWECGLFIYFWLYFCWLYSFSLLGKFSFPVCPPVISPLWVFLCWGSSVNLSVWHSATLIRDSLRGLWTYKEWLHLEDLSILYLPTQQISTSEHNHIVISIMNFCIKSSSWILNLSPSPFDPHHYQYTTEPHTEILWQQLCPIGVNVLIRDDEWSDDKWGDTVWTWSRLNMLRAIYVSKRCIHIAELKHPFHRSMEHYQTVMLARKWLLMVAYELPDMICFTLKHDIPPEFSYPLSFTFGDNVFIRLQPGSQQHLQNILLITAFELSTLYVTS